MNPNPNRPDDQTVVGSRPVLKLDDAGDVTANQTGASQTAADQTAADQNTRAPVPAPSDVTVVRVSASSPTVDEMADATNFGKYKLDGEIARGGMGVVYKARQKGLDRHVALKMILGVPDKEAAHRFLQEARAAAALDHPNVVPIYDIDEIGGKPYFTMALVEGPNLRGHVDAAGQLPVPQVISLFAQVVAGVAHAHKHGIIHRDLKPANVLMDKDGRPRVTDFGLAKRSSSDVQLTTTGQVVGTPAYMAPEQARDSKDVGPPADVYSLGAILYFLLTGKAPFHADSVTDLLIKVVMEPPVPPGQTRPDVPGDLEALCLKCLAKSPGERFANAQELFAALAPLADQYLPASANLTPSAAALALPRPGSAPSTGSVPFANAPSATSTASVPSLGQALAKNPPVPRPAAEPATTERLPDKPRSTQVAAAAEAPPAPNRTLLYALAGAAALLAVVAVAILATQGKKDTPPPPETAKGDEKDKPRSEQGASNAAANLKAAAAWPAPTRADFALKAQLSAPGSSMAPDGTLRLPVDTPAELKLTADRDCTVSVWILEPDGNMTRVFPNEHETDDRFRAGQERVLPGNGKYTLNPELTVGAGTDRLRVLATTGTKPVFPQGVPAGPFTTYTAQAEREKVVLAVRGLVVKKTNPDAKDGAVAEAEIPFRVGK